MDFRWVGDDYLHPRMLTHVTTREIIQNPSCAVQTQASTTFCYFMIERVMLIHNTIWVYFPNLHLNYDFRVEICGFRIKTDLPYGQTSQSVTGNLPFITVPSHERQRTHAVTTLLFLNSLLRLTTPAKTASLGIHRWPVAGNKRPIMMKVCLCNNIAMICMYMKTSSKWKHFPGYWPFVRRMHQSPANSPHKVNKHDAGDLRRHRAYYDVTVVKQTFSG